MTTLFLTMKDLTDATGFTSAGLYLQMRNGLFPRPLKLSPKASRWHKDEVQQVFEAWRLNKSPDEIKTLVAQLPSQIDLPPLPPPKQKKQEQQDNLQICGNDQQ